MRYTPRLSHEVAYIKHDNTSVFIRQRVSSLMYPCLRTLDTSPRFRSIMHHLCAHPHLCDLVNQGQPLAKYLVLPVFQTRGTPQEWKYSVLIQRKTSMWCSVHTSLMSHDVTDVSMCVLVRVSSPLKKGLLVWDSFALFNMVLLTDHCTGVARVCFA